MIKLTMRFLTNFYLITGYIFIIAAFGLLLIPYTPYVYYSLNANATDVEAKSIINPLSEKDHSNLSLLPANPAEPKVLENPPLDVNLPTENILSIPSIGVYGRINDGENAEKVHETGIWRASGYGNPENDGAPIILAAHRFGDIRWSNDFRNLNSFYKLPDTQVGDKIIIIWNQRQYEYKIVEAFDSAYIDDYSEDLILYTCRMIDSDVRVFRYAKRVK